MAKTATNKRASKATEASATAVLRVENIETYYGPIQAVKGLSIEVKEGALVTLLGANGAGKSSTLKTISGILEPDKGRVLLKGQDITGFRPDRVAAQGIAHVPEGREVFPFLSVRENLLMGAYLRSDKDAVERDIEAVYDYFPILRERADQRAVLLSGGQQQMLAIGRALLSSPSIMLLDEPSLGLSPLLVQEIFAIITRLNRERGVTMLLVEQNASVALEHADFGYVLELGRIVMDGPCTELVKSKDVQEFYLGMGESSAETAESGREDKRWKRKKTWR
ncbi:MAG: High-affinity branched-chain amino acid transport ATP-binding protein LivF [Rhodospirillaceae bacterium]|nr:ABC transporter ATP-binding protein [Rhodospirillaceae bacterium]CAI8402542.1 MAG: High-affinity branched-chain amino acid transport ATP-binding protein LivF [Rhodospirillaceae bacterium]